MEPDHIQDIVNAIMELRPESKKSKQLHSERNIIIKKRRDDIAFARELADIESDKSIIRGHSLLGCLRNESSSALKLKRKY